jgi:hypothetical protein
LYSFVANHENDDDDDGNEETIEAKPQGEMVTYHRTFASGTAVWVNITMPPPSEPHPKKRPKLIITTCIKWADSTETGDGCAEVPSNPPSEETQSRAIQLDELVSVLGTANADLKTMRSGERREAESPPQSQAEEILIQRIEEVTDEIIRVETEQLKVEAQAATARIDRPRGAWVLERALLS